ncbi:solute carrier family 45, member 1/2/4 [Geosmithia morbida]|uniref:Solute carrier family 45, member 1/2/4 n=1 Tax=Geosmithia morbida TaxID=1094350 RepID=A0A9P5D6H0_9HYPO|nr:solute carrier family 45, member 1/2/4 [Geosmithia morbida]KAF4123499.1 solute carrier family 45, member 1/2/4 [Geosmithia morbida]
MAILSPRLSSSHSNGESSESAPDSSNALAVDEAALDEQSPLFFDNEDDAPISSTNVSVDELQRTRSVWYLVLVTIGIGGLQTAWSVELSNGSPYLLSLGLSKSLMALVWIAGPLSGTLVQPYIGMLSDNCRLPWGKRKPFILGGTAATIVSLLSLAWVKELVGGFLGIFGADPDSKGVRVTTIVAAVVGIYVLDFSINTVQASIRAFIVDCAPAHQQEAANAMASRILGTGNIIGYVAGYADLRERLWFLGNSQFKILCALACMALGVTVALSTATVRERDPRRDGPPARNRPGLMAFFRVIFGSIKRLPPQIKSVCQVQFFSWIGFFPLLFYTSSYIGEIYVEPYLEENPHMTPKELEHLYEKATRIGTFALLINAIVSLSTNVLLPFFVAPTYDGLPMVTAEGYGTHKQSSSVLDRLRIPGLTLKKAWFLSLILFSVCMLCTVFVRSVRGATVLIGLAGITWAVALWAPWAIISAEISRRDALLRSQRSHGVSVGDEFEYDGEHMSAGEQERTDQAGVILGIHNMAIAAPQILATCGSSIIFGIWQKPRGTPGDHSVAMVMAVGGIFVLVASFFVSRIKDDISEVEGATADGDGEETRRLYRRSTTRHT